MPRKLLVLLLASAAFISCSSGDDSEPTPTDPLQGIELTDVQLARAALAQQDIGNDWEAQGAVPSTVQIGGRVGPANVEESEASATTAFKQKEGSGFLTNSVYAVANEQVACAIMAEHAQGAETKSWSQERDDGGSASFRNDGELGDKVPRLGDETFTAKITVQIEDAHGNRTERKIEYVAYRVGRVLSFLVSQDAGVGVLARKQEARLAEVLGL